MSPKTLGYFGTTRSVDSVLQTVFFFVQREIENHIIDLCLFFFWSIRGKIQRGNEAQRPSPTWRGPSRDPKKGGVSLSLSLSLSHLEDRSLSSSSFMRLFMTMVLRVIFLPGRLIRNSHGSHSRNTVRTWSRSDLICLFCLFTEFETQIKKKKELTGFIVRFWTWVPPTTISWLWLGFVKLILISFSDFMKWLWFYGFFYSFSLVTIGFSDFFLTFLWFDWVLLGLNQFAFGFDRFSWIILGFSVVFKKVSWIVIDLTGFDWIWLAFTGFYGVFLGFIGFDWVLLGFPGFSWVLLGLTGFSWVWLGLTGLDWVFLGFIGFDWVLLGLTGFSWVWLGLTGFD